MTRYFEVDVAFKETGTGRAEIVMPDVLGTAAWTWVQVDDAHAKALIKAEVADKAEQDAIDADPNCRYVTKDEMLKLQKGYPVAKVKHVVRAAGDEAALEIYQIVRHKHYLIDVLVE